MHHYLRNPDKEEYPHDHYSTPPPQQNPGMSGYNHPYNQLYPQQTNTTSSPFSLDLTDSTFWKGAVFGAVVALLVTNESVQKSVVKAASKVTAAARFGVEELKEKFEDAKAEVEAEAKAEAEAMEQAESEPEAEKKPAAKRTTRK